MISAQDFEKLRSSRPKGLSRLLLVARRNFVDEINKGICDSGLPPVPGSCLTILPYIDLEGTRSSEVANRAGMTKQAITQKMNQMEALGIIEKRLDPNDARAALVCYTELGISYLIKIHEIVELIEDKLGSELGEKKMRDLRFALEFMAYEWDQKINLR